MKKKGCFFEHNNEKYNWMDRAEIETGFGPDTRTNYVASRPVWESISGLTGTEMHLENYNLALCLMIHHSYNVYIV